MNHTPGPWKTGRIGGDWRGGKEKAMAFRVEAPEANGPKNWDVAVVYNKPVFEEAQANARLIASAPALLAALEGLVALDEGSGVLSDMKAYDDARSAIAAARGEK